MHRSQQDELVVDGDAPQRVLKQVQKKETPEEREKRIEEQHKYGIFFNDDTDYLEYLRERSDNRLEWPSHIDEELKERKNRFSLPSEVFPSATQVNINHSNEAENIKGIYLTKFI